MASSPHIKQTSLDLNLSARSTRKQEFLAQMERVVPGAARVERIAPYYPEGKNGGPPFALETMLRVHLLSSRCSACRIRPCKRCLFTDSLPSSTKNKDRARDPEMHSSQKGKQWSFGMKAHIGVDADLYLNLLCDKRYKLFF